MSFAPTHERLARACTLPVFIAAMSIAPGGVRARDVDFARDIRPIFEARCAKCHGEKLEKSGLRIDVRASVLKGGKSGKPAVVPGRSDESQLFRRVTSKDPEEVMPPEGDRLTAEQVALIRSWIDGGASWPDGLAGTSERWRSHWAYTAPVKPPVPEARSRKWIRNPIDAFVLARLEKEGLEPSPGADRITLLRRLHLDLTGLPPPVDEIDAYLADPPEEAYDRAVERLLASPHYGERWGRHWLDAARYADSDGFEKDKSRQVSFYRDWVIDAFNRDLPYDRFIIEQLAGDLLENATQDQVVATGFLRNSMVNEEGGIDPEQFRMDAMFDRMDAIGKGILGLTIQCAQCHTHKYDPITQEEYYGLFAFLNNDHEAQPVVYSPGERMKVSQVGRRIQEIEADLRRATPDWERRMEEWEALVASGQPEWAVVTPTQVSEGDTRFFEQEDGSLLGLGYAPTKFDFVFRAEVKAPVIRAFRLELFTDPNLPCGGPGRSFKGTCALTEFQVEAADAAEPAKKSKVKLVAATADFANEERELEPNFDDKSGKRRVTGKAEFAIDGVDETAWGIDAGPGRRNVDRKAVFVAEKDIAFPAGAVLTFHLVNNHGGWNSDDHMNNNLGRFRLSVTASGSAVADALPRRVREALSVPRGKRSPVEDAEVFSYWRTTVPEFREANATIEDIWREWPAGSTALALMPRRTPRRTAILQRGDWLKPGNVVTPGVPASLHPLPEGHDSSRLTLAKWLVDRRSPTTARVLANRIWQSLFGAGLVSTPEDFGMQSEPPSHPELLDWLATELIDRGWSVKEMIRLIVSSSTYRQSSRITPELHEKDPVNRLLARGARFRVEAELVRDIALATSGLLNARVGGPSVFSPAPEFLFQPPASYAPFPWKEETGEERYRRAIYTFRRRSTPYPMLQAFDAPNGDFSCVRRQRSNTPIQALASLNEILFVEAAQGLARRILEAGGRTDEERIAYAFRRVLAREPEADERQDLIGLLRKQERRIADGWVSASRLATGLDQWGEPGKVGTPELPPGTTPAELAAYTIVSRVLLNLDEAITRE
jgi:hypothetical protein